MSVDDTQTQTVTSGRSQILQAASIVIVAFILSRILGVVRDAVINYYFDIDSLGANAYFIASRFPETIFYIIAGGALGSAFIPTFSAYFVREDGEGGWRLFSAVSNLVVIATTIVSGITAVFAPQILELFYPDLLASTPGIETLAVPLMRVMLLSPIVFGVSGVIMSALNARQHFLLPALAPIVYNLGIILGALLFAPNVMGLAYGTIGGAVGHLLIQLPALRRKRAVYSPVITIHDPGVRQVIRLMAPRVLGLSFGQLNHLLMQFLAQSMPLGSIPALGIAWRIMIMPQGIIGQALGIAAFPTFSILAAQSALVEMRRILADTLRLIAFLSLPASVLLIILRHPIVAVLFERGQFGEESTELVAWVLLFYSFSLVGLAAIEIISRAFYAMEDTVTPVVVGALQLGSMWLFGAWLGNVLFAQILASPPAGGLAMGYSVSTFLELGLLLWLLRKKLGGLDGRHLLDGLWRMGIATALMSAVTYFIHEQLATFASLWLLLLGSIVGGLVYLAVCSLLKVGEIEQLMNYGRRLLRVSKFGNRSSS
ncbi:MAG: murein biosynthesis integral membrane protein MurJ [Candidatus Promineifilaceae bacterium]